MKNILAFVRAAAPWVAMALVLVLLTVRGATKKKAGKKGNSPAHLPAGSLVFSCILRGKMVFCRWKSILWNREKYPMKQEGFL